MLALEDSHIDSPGTHEGMWSKKTVMLVCGTLDMSDFLANTRHGDNAMIRE